MWFRNLQIYRLGDIGPLTATDLGAALRAVPFKPGGDLEMQSMGFVPPRDGGEFVYSVGRQMLFALCTEKKILPRSVIDEVVKVRAAELEEQQGFRPGRKQTRDLREVVTDELLPRAFAQRSITRIWLDPVDGRLVVDSATPAKADNVIRSMLRCLDPEALGITSLRTMRSPIAAMTNWLAADEAPGGFTVDQETELRATGESKATVRYLRHSLDVDELRRHIGRGKQCTRLAMTWEDKISFVLTDSLTLRRVEPLNVLRETEQTTDNDEERFAADMLLMTGELSRMLADVVAALGGYAKD